MHRLLRAFPLLPGKRGAFDAFVAEVRYRKQEVSQFYETYGVVRESWHLQSTPTGDIVICCTDLNDAAAAVPQYAESQAPFEVWFKSKVLELCGIDPNRQPEGPPAKPLFDWPGLA
jgi:hypothetical protein